MATTNHLPKSPEGFRHEAFMYDNEDSFLEMTIPFIEDGLRGDEAVLVVLSDPKIALLESRLGTTARDVAFASMDQVGANPARIIPAWRKFSDDNHSNRPMRGIGEPISAERSAAEMVECHNHEALLNVAFESSERFWLLCPYDTHSLVPEVIKQMAFTHPFLTNGTHAGTSQVYDFQRAVSQPFLEPLPEAPGGAASILFSSKTLGDVRAWIAAQANRVGLGPQRVDDLVLAVNEVATNSVRHGGGSGQILLWREDNQLVCDIVDTGHIRYALAGRELPPAHQSRGRGLWLVNQLCDLVQIRSSFGHTVVRLRQTISALATG